MLVFAQHLTRFAGYLRDAGLQPPQLEAIIVTAEVLRGRDRQLITSVFGCPVFGRYGSRETGVIASQCSENSHMHINAESVVVEFVRDNQHVAPGELGEVLVTDLRNYAMPLVRYRIGDVAAPQQGPCECGRGLPLMGPVVGRTADFITCPDGRLVNGVSLVSDLEASTSVSQAQIRQSEPGRLVVRLVPAEAFSRSAIDRLGAWLACHVSDRLVYGVEIVQEIPFERPSGKFRFVVSEIPPERLFGNTMTSAMAA
jgi:phenylacetate-CoA ligase